MRITRIQFAIALYVAIGAAAAWYFLRDSARQTRAMYIKREYRIPMRDGVALFTQVYIPRDNSKTYPFLIHRTPFSVQPYGDNRYLTMTIQRDYCSAFQHMEFVRGARLDSVFVEWLRGKAGCRKPAADFPRKFVQ